jgi:predicted metal-dependent RNase
MSDIKVVPLGAGQDVGRSCILVSMGGKNIMLDCGMHMGFNDEVYDCDMILSDCLFRDDFLIFHTLVILAIHFKNSLTASLSGNYEQNHYY